MNHAHLNHADLGLGPNRDAREVRDTILTAMRRHYLMLPKRVIVPSLEDDKARSEEIERKLRLLRKIDIQG